MEVIKWEQYKCCMGNYREFCSSGKTYSANILHHSCSHSNYCTPCSVTCEAWGGDDV